MPSHREAAENRNPLFLHQEFSMLSLTDLLDAREKNHEELVSKQNVVGTAVGLYLIRREDPWPPSAPRSKRGPRTLANSEVRPYSWPCILAFVREWEDESSLPWDKIVPRALYLNDNRKVPVCVVEAPPVLTGERVARKVVFPSNRMGGGFPVIAQVQEREHIASIGCLVTDGHTAYALTNRHVTGEAGEIVYAKSGGLQVRVGVSSRKQLTRKRFNEVYPGWPGKDTYLHMDIGLIRVDDVNQWTAQIFGIGTIGEVADLGMNNLSLRLIDTPVRAYGCASGMMEGVIKALFYRYHVMFEEDYVSDFLIGAPDEQSKFATHPGDSGTVWFMKTRDGGEQPVAVQWGGQLFSSSSGAQESCALATCLSTVCNLLDVDVIRDWNIGGPEYWGETGHYTIGAFACAVKFPGLPGLQKLMSNNLDRVGFKQIDLKQNERILRSKAHYTFVPLADVADEVWRFTRPSDSNNHFADMDQPAVSGPYKGKTLLDLCKNPKNINPQVWVDFYAAVPGTNPGSLPFRVWQIYDAMVDYAKQADALHFVAAAGCLGHYVGDACQPLHISRLHHGIPPVKKGSVAYAVHAVYETQMINMHASEIVDGVAKLVSNKEVRHTFESGFGAAQRVIALMQSTVNILPPTDIVDGYSQGTSPSDRLNRLWQDFGEKTVEVMAQGCICLADIWASAWKEGGGEEISLSQLGAADEGVLESYYNDARFLPSVGLPHLVQLLQSPGGVGESGGAMSQRHNPANAATNGNKKTTITKTGRVPGQRKSSTRKQAGKTKK